MIVSCAQPIKRMSREMLSACERLPGFEWRAHSICGLVGLCYVKIREDDIRYGCKLEEKMSTFLSIFDFLRRNGVIVQLHGSERIMYSIVLKATLDMNNFARRHRLPLKEMIHVRMKDASVYFRKTGCVITSRYEHDVDIAETKALEMMAQPC